MTREEAIARIKDHIAIHRYHEQNAVKIIEALDMAIKALEQPESCEDAVNKIKNGQPSVLPGNQRQMCVSDQTIISDIQEVSAC